MAALTDDFGSDAEEYEDALEELRAEEEAQTNANLLTEAHQLKGEKDSETQSTNGGVETGKGDGGKTDNKQSETTENLAEKKTERVTIKDDEDSDNKLSESETEESEDDEDYSASTEKPYCDIPADPSEEDQSAEALHERLNARADSEEEDVDAVDDGEGKVRDIYFVDEAAMKELEANMTDEDKLAKKEEAQVMKAEGNEQFKAGEYLPAMDSYTKALTTCPTCFVKERAIMYSNRAACRSKRELYDASAGDCSLALALHPTYVKALLRRADCYEKTEKLEQALEDYQKLLDIDPSLAQARAACMRLPEQIKEKNEKLKEEMMSKMKELGNMVLKPFGLSTNNFNLVQNPDTGSYSVNFNNNGS